MALGAFGLHPLDQIVNVHWGARATGLIDQFMQETPQWLLSFAFKVLNDDGTLAVPNFGNNQNLPTSTQTQDQTIIVDAFHTIIISGGTVSFSTPRLVLYSWKGFVIFQNYILAPGPPGPFGEPTVIEAVDPGSYTCFDSKGKPTTVDKLPKEDSKGAAIVSAVEPDTPGTWYMSVDKGLRKFDQGGNLIISLGHVDTAIYDTEKQQLRVVWTSGAPDGDFSGQAEIAWFDLDGIQQTTKLIGDEDFNGSDCSKNGRIYGARKQGGGRDPNNFPLPTVYSIEGYDYDGSRLFSIDPIGGFGDADNQPEVFDSITCYGEDYIVATTVKTTQGSINMGIVNGSLVQDLFTTNQQRRLIYDAKSGAQVDAYDYGEMRTDSTQIVRQTNPIFISETINTTSAYNIDQGVSRNHYFPVVDFKLPT